VWPNGRLVHVPGRLSDEMVARDVVCTTYTPSPDQLGFNEDAAATGPEAGRG
jgi:hypothetical protein